MLHLLDGWKVMMMHFIILLMSTWCLFVAFQKNLMGDMRHRLNGTIPHGTVYPK